MLVTLAGAMSTAELGLSLAEMIRQQKVDAICCTGANLEEDVFNLVAHDYYVRVPNYRELAPEDEQALLDRHLNRVTDTCIPEAEAMRRVERFMIEEWRAAEARGERLFPHEFFYRVLRRPELIAVRADPARRQLALRRDGAQPSSVRARMGGFDAREHVRGPDHRGRASPREHRPFRRRGHDRAGRVVHAGLVNQVYRILPGRRRDRGRLPDLRGADAAAGPQARRSRSGAISARSAIRRRATARTPARHPTRRSPGKSSPSTLRSS